MGQQVHQAYWVPSHGKKRGTWAPPVTHMGTERQWRTLNGAADAAAAEGARLAAEHYGWSSFQRRLHTAARRARVLLGRMYSGGVDYATASPQMRDRWSYAYAAVGDVDI